MKSLVGFYHGVYWHRKRICDVLVVENTAPYYFILEDGEYTGDHFRTQEEMFRYIDSLPKHADKEPVN